MKSIRSHKTMPAPPKIITIRMPDNSTLYPAIVHAIRPNIEDSYLKKGDYVLSINTPAGIRDLRTEYNGNIQLYVTTGESVKPKQTLFILEVKAKPQKKVKLSELQKGVKSFRPQGLGWKVLLFLALLSVIPMLNTFLSREVSQPDFHMVNTATAADSFLSSEYWSTATFKQVEQAIHHGADVNAIDDNGISALMVAVLLNGNPEIIRLFIKNGADVTAKSKGDLTALMAAAEHNANPEIINLLIKHGGDVNAKDDKGRTPLIHAAKNNENPEVISLLIKHGANVNAQDEDGISALVFAVGENKNIKVISLLLKHGADVNMKVKDNGWLALMAAAESKGRPEVVRLLIKHGANVNAKDYMGRTALMYAASGNKNNKVIRLLIAHGADVYIKDRTGKMAFDYAKNNESSDIYKELRPTN